MSQGRTETRESFRRELIQVVRNTRRRYALYYLYTEDRPVDLMELTEQVAAWEEGVTPENVSSDRRRSVYNSLRQTHLPKLENTGLVAADLDSNTVELTDTGADLEMYLANDPQTRVQWRKVYLLVGVAGLAGVGLSAAGVFPFSVVPATVLAGILAVTVVAVALLHWYDVYRWRRKHENAAPDFAIEIRDDDE